MIGIVVGIKTSEDVLQVPHLLSLILLFIFFGGKTPRVPAKNDEFVPQKRELNLQSHQMMTPNHVRQR